VYSYQCKSVSVLITAFLLTIAPAAAQTIYAVVLGNQKYVVGSSTLHSGLFATGDYGVTWRHLGPENLKAFSFDAVDAQQGATMFIAAGNGIHRSLDTGHSWKIVTDWRMTEVLDVKVDQKDPRWVYAATAFGFWRSSDGGASWAQPQGALLGRYVYRIDELEWPGGIYASADSGIYESIDYGQTWRRAFDLPSPHGFFQIGGASPIVASGRGPLLLDRAMSGAVPHPSTPEAQTYDIVFGRDATIYAAGENGVWSLGTGYGMPRWEDITGALPIRTIHALAYSADRDVLLAGTWGEGVYRRSHTGWVPAGLEGSQVWRLVVKPY
jgi:photosystem II stability/assembly factor-like uncharacterized protein